MKKTLINPPSFSPALGAYSHGLRVDLAGAAMIFVTGQLALDPDGNVVSEDVQEQTRYVLENIKTILEQAGAALEDVVKIQYFVADIDDFEKISAVRNGFFGEIKPASTLVAVAGLAAPGCKIEVEAIAMKSNTAP